jgi:acyl-CoA dehydrogenase
MSTSLDHRAALREVAREFTRREVVPHLQEWEDAGEVPRELHRTAAKHGLLGVAFPSDVGGEGGDLLDSIAVQEAMFAEGASSGLMAALFTSGIALPHLAGSGNTDLIDRFVRPTLAGELIGSLAVTEPGGGSDVAAIRTTAVREGDVYVVNGTKTFITSGVRADFVTTAVRTGGPGHGGISLLVVEKGMPGFTVDRSLALAAAFCRERETFGKPLIANQVVRHRLVEMHRRVEVARSYTHAVAARHVAGESVVAEACLAKQTAVEASSYVCDEAVQLHGGTGYLRGTEVERHYRDARILPIGGGSTEVLTDLAARLLGYSP